MVCYIALTICWMFLIVVSQQYAAVGAANLATLQTLGEMFVKGNDAISNILVIVFSLDAVMLYVMLYRSRLVPRWISIWGFIAILMHFSTAFLIMFHILGSGLSPIIGAINLPIFLQEMVMAVWFIGKGFDRSALLPEQETHLK